MAYNPFEKHAKKKTKLRLRGNKINCFKVSDYLKEMKEGNPYPKQESLGLKKLDDQIGGR